MSTPTTLIPTVAACDKCGAKMFTEWRGEPPVAFTHICGACRTARTTKAPTYGELLDELQSLADDLDDYVNQDDRDLPDHGSALALVQRARAAFPETNFIDGAAPNVEPEPNRYRATIRATVEEMTITKEGPTLSAALLAMANELHNVTGEVNADIFRAMHEIQDAHAEGRTCSYTCEDFGTPENNFEMSAEEL